MAFHDHFSKQAVEYTKFRPRYPRELFQFLATVGSGHRRVWDCGTGNGQAAVALAEFFDEVIATDASARQIAEAEQRPNVKYSVSPAEQCPLEADSVDLVTVAQAIHWFDFPRFNAEVRRVGRRASALAAWSYGLAVITPEVDRVVHYLYSDILGAYWPPERKVIEDEYRTIDFPFEELPAPRFAMTAQWSLAALVGYLGTWSSLQQYVKQHGENPLEKVQGELVRAWGDEPVRKVDWPLYMRLGRIK